MPGGAAGNNLTGVDPVYRGRGIARALKLKTIEWAREHDVESIYTQNDIENRRMLAINISLGYKPLPTEVEMVKDLPG
jgi:GNAT superfamily N-acetyltransferase